MKILPLAQDTSAWDRYVRAHRAATFFHQAAWRQVIERAFQHRTHYLVAEQDGAIAGVLPLAQVKTRLFGHAADQPALLCLWRSTGRERRGRCRAGDRGRGTRRRLGADATELRFLADPAPAVPGPRLDQARRTLRNIP